MEKKTKKKDYNRPHPKCCLYCGDKLTKKEAKKDIKICDECEE